LLEPLITDFGGLDELNSFCLEANPDTILKSEMEDKRPNLKLKFVSFGNLKMEDLK